MIHIYPHRTLLQHPHVHIDFNWKQPDRRRFQRTSEEEILKLWRLKSVTIGFMKNHVSICPHFTDVKNSALLRVGILLKQPKDSNKQTYLQWQLKICRLLLHFITSTSTPRRKKEHQTVELILWDSGHVRFAKILEISTGDLFFVFPPPRKNICLDICLISTVKCYLSS